MRIIVIGANGAAGSRIVSEARRRRHEVTEAHRRASSSAVRLDASDAGAVARGAAAHDVIVAATRPDPGRESDVAAAIDGLADGAARAGRRLLVVGGAAPLRVPGTDRIALDDPAWVPPDIRSIAAASRRQLELLRAHPDARWVYLAPAALFAPGERTGRYATADGELVIGPDGSSAISMEDFAVAVLDEIERPGADRRLVGVGPAAA